MPPHPAIRAAKKARIYAGGNMMAICYEEPGRTARFNRAIRYGEQGYA